MIGGSSYFTFQGSVFKFGPEARADIASYGMLALEAISASAIQATCVGMIGHGFRLDCGRQHARPDGRARHAQMSRTAARWRSKHVFAARALDLAPIPADFAGDARWPGRACIRRSVKGNHELLIREPSNRVRQWECSLLYSGTSWECSAERSRTYSVSDHVAEPQNELAMMEAQHRWQLEAAKGWRQRAHGRMGRRDDAQANRQLRDQTVAAIEASSKADRGLCG